MPDASAETSAEPLPEALARQITPTLKQRLGKVKAVISDADNTLWDILIAGNVAQRELRDAVLARTNDARRKGGMAEISQEKLDSQLYPALEEARSPFLHTIFDKTPILTESFPGQDVNAVFKPEVEAFKAREIELSGPFDGAKDNIAQLREAGFAFYVFSGSRAPAVAERFERFGMAGAEINGFYSANSKAMGEDFAKPPEMMDDPEGVPGYRHRVVRNMGNPKRDDRGWRMVLDELGLRPDEVLVVGDNLAEDVGHAQAIGALGVYARYGEVPRQTLEETRSFHWYSVGLLDKLDAGDGERIQPDLVLSKPDDLAAVIRHLGVKGPGVSGPEASQSAPRREARAPRHETPHPA